MKARWPALAVIVGYALAFGPRQIHVPPLLRSGVRVLGQCLGWHR